MIPAGATLGHAPTLTAVDTTKATVASLVIAEARSHLGDPWVAGATGPNSFDCSGLVYRSFYDAHHLGRIGGERRSSYALYDYFKARGWADKSNPQPGDLVVYGYSGVVSHVGIYMGGGKTISTLDSGVTIHDTFAVTKPMIAYLHTHSNVPPKG
jgi:cell wall-associated NlpC family hydrolase